MSGRWEWAPYGNVMVEIHGPRGEIIDIGRRHEKRRRGLVERAGRPEASGRLAEEVERIDGQRDEFVELAKRVCDAMNAAEGL